MYPGRMLTSKQLENELMKIVNNIVSDGITMSKPGSIKYLLFGSEPSRQAISIKMGNFGEIIPKKIIEHSNKLELLRCGVQCIDTETKKKKDLDLLWKDEDNKTIYYREAKGNIDLDSEKLPATLDKIKEILDVFIKPKYPDYDIDIGVFNWSVYNRKHIETGISNIRKCENKGIKVEHMEDMLKLLNFEWNEEDYISFFREAGVHINTMFNNS